MRRWRAAIAAAAGPGPAFGRFWLARTLSIMGDRMTMVAVVTASYTDGHGVAGAGAVMLAFTLPRLLGPVCGAVADRLDARTLMPCLDVAQALVIAALLLLIRSGPATVALVTASTLISTVYMPAGRRSIIRLARPGTVRQAYAAIGTSWSASWACGPAVGGGLVALGGVRLPLAVDVATFLGSAVLMRTLPALPPGENGGGQRLDLPAVLRTLRDGVAMLARTPRARAVLVNLFVVVAFGSMDTIVLLVMSDRTFHTGSGGYGLLLSMFGVGMLGGSAGVSVMRRASAGSVLVRGEIWFAAGTLATGFAPVAAAAMAAQLATGLGQGIETVGRDLMLADTMPPELLGTVTGVVLAVPYLGNLVANSAAPVLVDTLGPRYTLLVSAGGVLAAALAVRWSGRLRQPKAPAGPPAPAIPARRT